MFTNLQHCVYEVLTQVLVVYEQPANVLDSNRLMTRYTHVVGRPGLLQRQEEQISRGPRPLRPPPFCPTPGIRHLRS